MTQLPDIPFWFIRHGQTDYNAAGLAQGASDIDLNEVGRAQAQQAAPLLVGRGIGSIICSPMRRAKQTAEVVNELLHLSVTYEAELREACFGDKEGQAAQQWFPDWVSGNYTPENAESFENVMERTRATLWRVLPDRKAPALIVAHGGILRAIRALMGLPKEALTGNAIPLYCEPTVKGWQISEAEAVGKIKI